MWRTCTALISIALLLGGCSTTRVVDSDVQAFSTIQQIGEPPTYRFERLPSQQAHPAAQDQLEDIAQHALERVGMVRDDAQPRYSVQVETRLQRNDPRPTLWSDPWYGPWGGPWGGGPWGGPWGGRYHHPAFGSPWGFPPGFMDPTVYEREVRLVMRKLPAQQVVFETRATHEALWPGDTATLAAMFDAALSGFPQPPEGVRRLRIELPKAPAASGQP